MVSRSKAKNPWSSSPEDDTGVFRRMLDEETNLNRIAHRYLRATVNTEGLRPVVIVTRDFERADNLRKLLVERQVGDSIGIASSIATASDMIRERQPTIVVAEPELAEVMKELMGGSGRVVTLNGHDEETADQLQRETP